jgi:hypothetical protein
VAPSVHSYLPHNTFPTIAGNKTNTKGGTQLLCAYQQRQNPSQHVGSILPLFSATCCMSQAPPSSTAAKHAICNMQYAICNMQVACTCGTRLSWTGKDQRHAAATYAGMRLCTLRTLDQQQGVQVPTAWPGMADKQHPLDCSIHTCPLCRMLQHTPAPNAPSWRLAHAAGHALHTSHCTNQYTTAPTCPPPPQWCVYAAVTAHGVQQHARDMALTCRCTPHKTGQHRSTTAVAPQHTM